MKYQPIEFNCSDVDRLWDFLKKVWPSVEYTRCVNGDIVDHVFDCDRDESATGCIVVREGDCPNGVAHGEFARVLASSLKPNQFRSLRPQSTAAAPLS